MRCDDVVVFQNTLLSLLDGRYILANREQEMNEDSRDNSSEDLIPWRKFFGSSAFWGLVVAHFSYNWGTCEHYFGRECWFYRLPLAVILNLTIAGKCGACFRCTDFVAPHIL